MEICQICLDGKKVSTLELWRVHRITSRRQQFETMYGSYNPVRPSDMQVDLQHASDDGNSISRVNYSATFINGEDANYF